MTDVTTVWITGKISLLCIHSGAGVISGGARSFSGREGIGPDVKEPWLGVASREAEMATSSGWDWASSMTPTLAIAGRSSVLGLP